MGTFGERWGCWERLHPAADACIPSWQNQALRDRNRESGTVEFKRSRIQFPLSPCLPEAPWLPPACPKVEILTQLVDCRHDIWRRWCLVQLRVNCVLAASFHVAAASNCVAVSVVGLLLVVFGSFVFDASPCPSVKRLRLLLLLLTLTLTLQSSSP